MPATSVLSAPWEAYEKKKILNAEDPSVFVPEELWEFNYLLDSISLAQPQVDPITAMLAIRQAMRNTVAPRPRNFFIGVVMESIRERENQWAQIVSNSQQDAA